MYEANISVKILMQVNASSVATNAISINATMYYYFPSPDINEIMYYINNHMCYLNSIAESIEASKSIEHQSAKTYP